MATTTQSSSTKRALNGASRTAKRLARRTETKGQQFTNFLSRESTNIARKAGDLYSTTATATRKHPIAAVGIVAGVAALVSGLWYAARNR